MDQENSKLYFVKKQQKGHLPTITARLTVGDGDKREVYHIPQRVRELCSFAEELSMEQGIPFHKRSRKRNDGSVEMIRYENAEMILEKFQDQQRRDQERRQQRGRVFLGGSTAVLATTGVLAVSDAISNYNQQEEEIGIESNSLYMIDDSLEAGIMKEIDRNPKLPRITIQENPNEMVAMPEEEYPVFSFSSEDKSDGMEVQNAKENMLVFEKYGKMYGVDPQLLMAIMAQESGGIHKDYSQNGCALGGMQIENIWFNKDITAYNFDLQDWETETISEKELKGFDYNVQIACMILQYGMNYYKYDILKGIQCYNYGYPNLNKLVNKYGDDWIICNRELYNKEGKLIGDPDYLETILSFLPNNSTIVMTKPDGEKVGITLGNQYCNTYSPSISR